MATAQQRGRNVRARIDETTNTQSSSPSAAAKAIVTLHCESLQPDLQDILIDCALNKFLNHMGTANRKLRAVNKMQATAEYIPRSIKLNCELFCTELAKQDAEYNNLAEYMTQCVTTFQNSAKQCVIQATTLDANVHKAAAKKHFCEGLFNIVSGYLTLNGHPSNQVHKFANTIIERHHDVFTPIFELNDFATLEQAQETYITFTTATAPLPVPFLNPDAHLQHIAPAGAAQNPYNNANAVANIDAATRRNEATLSQIWRSVHTCFVDAWAAFLRQQEANDTALRLKKLSTELLTRTATEAAQMQVDQEVAADPPLLQALIAQQVAQETANLRGTVQRLQAQLNTNTRSPRGASRNQQETNTGRGRGRGRGPRQARGGQGADAHANASTARNRNNSTSRSNRRSGGRNNNSNNNGNRQQQRSRRGSR